MNCKLTLGEKLKDLRTAAGLSLVELEEATGISKSALGSYELHHLLPWQSIME